MKLSAALEGYWLDKRLEFSENTIRNYGYVFRYLGEFLGDTEIESITSDDIRRFLDYLRTKRKMSKRSVHDAWIPLSSLWTWAGKELGLPHIIRGHIAEPVYTKNAVEPFSENDIGLLMDAAEYIEQNVKGGKAVTRKRPTELRDKALILVFADTGLRVSEFCSLNIADYDQKRGRLHIRRGKGDKGRFVVMGNKAQKALWRYLNTRRNARPNEPLFVTDNGRMKRGWVLHLVGSLGKRAGGDAHPHKFRHFYAISFLRAGGNVLLLQELLGHESLEMVSIYVQLAERDIDQAAKHSPVDNMRI